MSISKYFKPTIDVPSPRDLIPQSAIKYSGKQITIDGIEPNVWITTVADTNSMDPTVDAGHTCVLTTSFKPEELAIGDVVIYANGTQLVLHRIVNIEEDNQGRKFTLKGDNNYKKDPHVIRDAHIRYLLLMIIY